MIGRISMLLLLAAAAACRSEEPLSYVRVSLPAPAFAGVDPARPVLLSFWASWCEPCAAEVEGLKRLAASDLELVVAVVDEPPAAASRAFGDAARIVEDPVDRLAGQLRVGRLPVSFLVVGGRAIARFEGKRDWGSSVTVDALRKLAQAAGHSSVDPPPAPR